MNTRATKKAAPRQRRCVYCNGPYESSDHSPPKCLLSWPPAPGAKVLTLPACIRCNQSTSRQESIVWIMLALVSRHPILKEYCSEGGKVDRAFAHDPSLRSIIEGCKNADGNYDLAGEVQTAFDRILRKTAQGLYYGLYDRVPPLDEFELLSIEHCNYCSGDDVVSRLRRPSFRDIAEEPMPSIGDRGLPNVYVVEAVLKNPITGESHVVRSVLKDVRQEDVEWTIYQPETVRFTFFQDEAGDAICVMDLWGTLVAAVKAPWPNQRGTLRKGKRNPNARK